jgi:hypothetical protein
LGKNQKQALFAFAGQENIGPPVIQRESRRSVYFAFQPILILGFIARLATWFLLCRDRLDNSAPAADFW